MGQSADRWLLADSRTQLGETEVAEVETMLDLIGEGVTASLLRLYGLE